MVASSAKTIRPSLLRVCLVFGSFVTVNAISSTFARLKVANAVDADSCRQSWESYVQRDIQVQSEYSRILAYARSHSTATVPAPLTTTTVTTVAVGPAWAECDGIPRRKFLEELRQTVIVPNMSTSVLYDIQPAPSEPPETMMSIAPYPSCTIAPQHCQEQWESFKQNFNSFTTMDGSNTTRGIDFWVAKRYASKPVGVFGGCSQPTELCLLGQNNTSGMVDMRDRIFEEQGCDIQAGRFVLIYFPPQSIVSRDLCANDGWGTALTIEAASPKSPVTATLKEIGFRKFSHFDEHYPETTITGDWTFTSPSVYLAYDTIQAKVFDNDETMLCPQPGRVYRNGILTMRLDELSSYGWEPDSEERLTSTSRLFSLADLHGPVPARAHFLAKCGDFDPDCHSRNEIIEGEYNPWLVLPEAVRRLDPAFKRCFPFSRIPSKKDTCYIAGWDPPIELRVASAQLAVPTLPASPAEQRYPGAVPAASLPSPQAYATAARQPIPTSDGYHGPSESLRETQARADPNSGQTRSFDPWDPSLGPSRLPSTVVNIAGSEITAAALPHPREILFGSKTLELNGPSIKVAGEDIAFRPDGLIIGETRTVRMFDTAGDGMSEFWGSASSRAWSFLSRPVAAEQELNSATVASSLRGHKKASAAKRVTPCASRLCAFVAMITTMCILA